MKNSLLKRVAVFTICAGLFVGTAWAAATVTKTIQVEYCGIQLVVDGVPVTPKDSNGTTVEPFIYNGTTYLPVRAVGNAIGKQVTWDGNAKIVYLGDAPEQVNYMVDVCPAYEKSSYTEYQSMNGKSFAMSGSSYSNGFTIRGDEGYALFNLNGKYETLSTTIGHVDKSHMEGRVVTFVVDGKTVATYRVGAEDLPQKIDVPLNFGLQLKIIVTDDEETKTSWVYNAEIGFANATLS